MSREEGRGFAAQKRGAEVLRGDYSHYKRTKNVASKPAPAAKPASGSGSSGPSQRAVRPSAPVTKPSRPASGPGSRNSVVGGDVGAQVTRNPGRTARTFKRGSVKPATANTSTKDLQGVKSRPTFKRGSVKPKVDMSNAELPSVSKGVHKSVKPAKAVGIAREGSRLARGARAAAKKNNRAVVGDTKLNRWKMPKRTS